MKDSNDVTGFTHSILHHILNGSSSLQANSIIRAFLGTLLRNVLKRNQPCFLEDGSSAMTVKKILEASGGELLEALTDAVVEIESIQDTIIVIDGIDNIGKNGALFLQKFCLKMMASSIFKALFTCRPDPDIKRIVNGFPCIDYDKERQGLSQPFSLAVSVSN
jgi:hypothetical protein